MAINSWRIYEAQIVTEGGLLAGDLWVHRGRIASVGHIPDKAVGSLLHARERWLLPGLIDTHVHFRDPGLRSKGSFYTESRAALAGGVTTVFDMPNVQPATTSRAALEAKAALMAGRSWVNYAFYLGATPDNLEEIRRLNPKQVPGVKVFLASSTGDLLVTHPHQVEAIIAASPVRVVFHSEVETLIQAAHQRWGHYTWDEVLDLHTRCRPAEACIQSTQYLLELASRYQTPLHILHVTTEGEVDLLRGRPPHVTAETCPVYIMWDAQHFATYQNRLKCNPSLKYTSDREALWRGVAEGVFDTIGTDHAPHTLAEKQRPYLAAPSGVPTHPYLLPWLYAMGAERGIPLVHWVRLAAWQPARLWRIQDRGQIQEGAWADLVLFDPAGQTVVPPDGHPNSLNYCGWHPLAGHTLQGAVRAVWVNGYLSYAGEYFWGRPSGMAVAFGD